MYETDRKDACDYGYISEYLEKHGFKQREIVVREGNIENICWLK